MIESRPKLGLNAYCLIANYMYYTLTNCWDAFLFSSISFWSDCKCDMIELSLWSFSWGIRKTATSIGVVSFGIFNTPASWLIGECCCGHGEFLSGSDISTVHGCPITAESIGVNSEGDENLSESEIRLFELTSLTPGRSGSLRLGRKLRNPVYGECFVNMEIQKKKFEILDKWPT